MKIAEYVGRAAVGLVIGAIAQVPLAAQELLGPAAESGKALALAPAPSPEPIVGGRMSCGTARLVSAPLGAGAGALGTIILYELVTAGSTSTRTPTAGADLRAPGSNRTALVLVGGGLGLVWGILAPPVARECWIQLPGHRGSGSAAAVPRRDPPPQGRLGFSNEGWSGLNRL